MTRLTKDSRNKIIENAVSKATHDKCSRRDELLNAFKQNVINFFNDTEDGKEATKIDKEIKKLVKQIPKKYKSGYTYNYVYESSYLYLNIGGMSYDLNTGYIIIPYNTRYERLVIPAEHELVNQFNELEKLRGEIEEIKNTVSGTVGGLVHSVTTVKRLIEVWPESVELIPKNIDRPLSNLPAVKIQDLNSMIGIPSK
jgi:Nucleotide modification associated domain 5